MLSATQLAKRSQSLGASDISALFGANPFRTSYDLWLEKTDRLLPDEPPTENDPRTAGHLLEPAVLNFAEGRLGKLRRNQQRSARAKGLPIVANLDAILIETGEPVEAKTSGLYGSTADVWGDAETDAVPDHIIIQAQTQMLVTEADVCHIPAFIAFRGFLMFRVERDAELIEEIGKRSLDFWLENVLADTPPTGIEPSLAVVKRMRRQPEKVAALDQTLVDSWRDWAGAESVAKKEKETALAAILAAIGDAEAGETPEGLFTYLEQTRKGYTVEESKYRVARWKKNK